MWRGPREIPCVSPEAYGFAGSARSSAPAHLAISAMMRRHKRSRKHRRDGRDVIRCRSQELIIAGVAFGGCRQDAFGEKGLCRGVSDRCRYLRHHFLKGRPHESNELEVELWHGMAPATGCLCARRVQILA